MATDADILLNGPLLSGIDRELVEEMLRIGKRRSFAVVETLMAQGETATAMYVILRGRVRVVRHMPDGNSVALAELGAGEGVGEIGMIDQRPRTATVVAIEPTDTIEIQAQTFTTLANSSSRFYELLARVLAQRLRATDELVSRRRLETVVAAPAGPARSPRQPQEANKALVARFRAAIAEGSWDAVAQLLAPDFTANGRSGAEAMQADLNGLTKSLAEAKTTITQVLADGDWVIELTTLTGVHQGEGLPMFAGLPATGKPISLQVVFLYRIVDGRIAERIRVADELNGLRQLGTRVGLSGG
jgi:CRP/FNR family transcriptional regulator, cyclic AMP receptor protein